MTGRTRSVFSPKTFLLRDIYIREQILGNCYSDKIVLLKERDFQTAADITEVQVPVYTAVRRLINLTVRTGTVSNDGNSEGMLHEKNIIGLFC